MIFGLCLLYIYERREMFSQMPKYGTSFKLIKNNSVGMFLNYLPQLLIWLVHNTGSLHIEQTYVPTKIFKINL